MQIDENYVGEPPKVEVTIENLNDNVDRQFLQGLVNKMGAVEELTIGHHPANRKHLGIARLVFEEVRSAKECVRVLHEKSVMGKPLTCYLDPSGASFKKLFQELTEDRKPEPPPPPPVAQASVQPPHPPPSEENPPTPEDTSSWERSERDPRSIDSRGKREGRHSSDRRKRSGRPSEDHHRRGSFSWKDERSVDEEDGSAYHRQPPPPPPPPSVSHPPPLPTMVSSGEAQYQPTSFDPQYSDPEYWLKQAQMYTASGTTQRSASQESEAEAVSSRVAPPPPEISSQNSSEGSSGLPPPPPLPLQTPLASRLQNFDLSSLGMGDDGGDTLDQEVAAAMEASSHPSSMAVNNQGDESDADEPKVDLDTRLKMLMKDKTGTMPAFLLDEFDGSESGEEQAEEEKPDSTIPDNHMNYQDKVKNVPPVVVFPLQPDEIPLSRAPSPFLSTKVYLQCHTEWVADRRRAMEAAEMQNIRQAMDNAAFAPHLQHPHYQQYYAANVPVKSRKNGRNRPRSRNSDQMSLSSLSSGENNILEQGPDVTMGLYPPFYAPPPLPGQQWNGAGMEAYHYQQAPVIDPATGYPMMPPPGYDGYYPWWEGQDRAAPVKKDPKDNIRPLIK